MIPFFVGYALAVWIPAARYRRRAIGLGVVLLGAAILVLIGLAHYQLRLIRPTWYIQGMQVILYPYTAMVVGVGAFIAALPRYRPGCCPHCAASLAGAAPDEPVCPECRRTMIPGECPVCHYDLSGHEQCHDRCPECAFSFLTQTKSPRPRRACESAAHEPVGTALPASLAAAGVGLSPGQAPHGAHRQDEQRQTRDQ